MRGGLAGISVELTVPAVERDEVFQLGQESLPADAPTLDPSASRDGLVRHAGMVSPAARNAAIYCAAGRP